MRRGREVAPGLWFRSPETTFAQGWYERIEDVHGYLSDMRTCARVLLEGVPETVAAEDRADCLERVRVAKEELEWALKGYRFALPSDDEGRHRGRLWVLIEICDEWQVVADPHGAIHLDSLLARARAKHAAREARDREQP